jgi:hypothetical protein
MKQCTQEQLVTWMRSNKKNYQDLVKSKMKDEQLQFCTIIVKKVLTSDYWWPILPQDIVEMC